MEQKLQGENYTASLIKQLKTYSRDLSQFALALLLAGEMFALLG